MAGTRVILGDWGTSRLRLYLCESGDVAPSILGKTSGPGVRDVNDFERAFIAAAQSLPEHPRGTTVVLCGMVGSSVGWRETSYLPCPVVRDQLCENFIMTTAGAYPVHIVPGVSCINRYGYFDVLRGEETQLFGWTASRAGDTLQRLVCLPGTHSKWALLRGGEMVRFDTTVPGELFDVLSRFSILTRGAASAGAVPAAHDAGAFSKGVDLIRDNPGLSILQALFSARSLLLSGELQTSASTSFLSGLLIAADIRDVGLALVEAESISEPVVLLGAPALTGLYHSAFERFDTPSETVDGEMAAIAGLAGFAAEFGNRAAIP